MKGNDIKFIKPLLAIFLLFVSAALAQDQIADLRQDSLAVSGVAQVSPDTVAQNAPEESASILPSESIQSEAKESPQPAPVGDVQNTSDEAAQKSSSEKDLSPFDHLGHNMLWSAFGWPLVFHLAGGGATYLLSTNDVDLKVARFAARQNEIAYGIAFTPGMLMGTFFPVLVPGYMYFFSDSKALNNTGAVAAQATAVAFLYNNIMKAVSGREHPKADENTGERSRDFKWGFFRRGVFYGWPSGHSMTNAALAMSIASYNRDNPYVVAGCGLYASYVATSMVLGAKGEAHWFSDAVAGVLMGASIGWYIGSTFYDDKPSAVKVAPVFYEDHKGAVISMRF